MLTFKRRYLRSIGQYVGQNLGLNLRDARHTLLGRYMVAKVQGGTSVIISELGWKCWDESCLADPDLWMREAVHSNGSKYYEYILLYVDDALCVSEFPKEALLQVDKYFPMKKGSIGPPDIYLGGKVRKVELPNGALAWSLSMSQYVEAAIANDEKNIIGKGYKLPSHTRLPMNSNYEASLDTLKN